MTAKSSGFSLVELLVVVAIIGILSTVGLVSYSGYVKGAKRNSAENITQQIALAQSEHYANTGSYHINGGADSCTATAATLMIVADQAVGTEVYVESFLFHKRGGRYRAARRMEFFDLGFGSLFFPKNFSGLPLESDG